jgi:hypothetical protein
MYNTTQTYIHSFCTKEKETRSTFPHLYAHLFFDQDAKSVTKMTISQLKDAQHFKSSRTIMMIFNHKLAPIEPKLDTIANSLDR